MRLHEVMLPPHLYFGPEFQDNDEDFQWLLNVLRHECSKFFDLSPRPLYRGAYSPRKQCYGIKDIPTARWAKDSSAIQVELADIFMDHLFDAKDLRKHSAFATGSIIIAKTYGVPMMVIPIDASEFYTFGFADSYEFLHMLETTVALYFKLRTEPSALKSNAALARATIDAFRDDPHFFNAVVEHLKKNGMLAAYHLMPSSESWEHLLFTGNEVIIDATSYVYVQPRNASDMNETNWIDLYMYLRRKVLGGA